MSGARPTGSPSVSSTSRPATAADGRPVTLVGFTITGAKIVAIDLIDDPRRIAEADLAILDIGSLR
jgi:RNA polymerase sigma-70 factor (ECF subfamily)